MSKRNVNKPRDVSTIENVIVAEIDAGKDTVRKDRIIDVLVEQFFPYGDAPQMATQIMRDGIEGKLEMYFVEAVKGAAKYIADRPWHLLTPRYYAKGGGDFPKTVEQARRQVSVFGNGRNSKAEGVRFVPKGATDDMMLMVATEKRLKSSQASQKASVKVVKKAIASGSISQIDSTKLLNSL